MLRIVPARSGVIDDEFTLGVGFQWRDDTGRERHVVVSAARMVEQQDIDLGHTGLHVELDDPSNSAYRAVAAIRLSPGGVIEIALSPEGQSAAGVPGMVVLTSDADAEARAMIVRLAAIAGIDVEEI